MPRPTMKEFIVALLEEKARPLSTTEIYQEFDRAGYRITKASIRGRLNSLTYDGQIRRVSFGRYAPRKLFNMLISGSDGTWEKGNAKIPRSRFLEYTTMDVASRFSSMTPESIRLLMSLPTVFAYEEGINTAARIGKLKDIHFANDSIEVFFEFDEDWPALEPKRLASIRDSLHFGRNEEYRTHWAVKEVDLYAVLNELGIVRNNFSEPEVPREPPPGPGPQYIPINGKLTEVGNPPSEEEAVTQFRLHSRLRDATKNLLEHLSRIGNQYPELLNAVREYSQVLSENLDALDVTSLWCVGGALGEYARSYRNQILRRHCQNRWSLRLRPNYRVSFFSIALSLWDLQRGGILLNVLISSYWMLSVFRKLKFQEISCYQS